MEAKSLASINYIAANPPQYPVKPSEDRLEPLTLYISRVPGTRDIILSPFKPQVKNVTGEDISNSLYYIHYDTSSPGQYAPGNVPGEEQGRSSSEGSHSSLNIRRKPLPDNARPVTPESLSGSAMPPLSGIHPPPQQQSSIQGFSLDPMRPSDDHLRPPPQFGHAQPPAAAAAAAAAPIDTRYDQQQMSYGPSATQMPARKPLGPRALGNPPPPPTTTTNPTSHPQNANIDAPLPPPPADYLQHPGSNPRRRSRSPKKGGDPFSLNLIRRDPGTGLQWNIGRVSSSGVADAANGGAPAWSQPVSATSSSASAPRPAIDIQLENSGYAKFRSMPTRKSLDSPGLRADPASAAASMLEDMQLGGGGGEASGFFSRQVVMSYSKSWSSQIKEKLNRLDKGRDGSGHGRLRSHSASGADGGPPTIIAPGQPGPGMKPRGYVFSSPWDGKCEFRTGNAGRSVRLHHTVHTGGTAAYNPLVATNPEGSPPDAASSVVSELRFNLPNSDVLPAGQDEHGHHNEHTSRGHQRLGSFAKLWRRDDGYDDGYDDDDGEISPFDVNLGKEHAGGGNRGRRAKLGKLIISHEGIKMLDLVVAANIGLWWVAWEKNF